MHNLEYEEASKKKKQYLRKGIKLNLKGPSRIKLNKIIKIDSSILYKHKIINKDAETSNGFEKEDREEKRSGIIEDKD